MIINMNKKYTFEGEEGEVLVTDRPDEHFPVVWMRNDGKIFSFTSKGLHFVRQSHPRLIEVKPTQWINVYLLDIKGPFDSRETADSDDACIRVIRKACVEFKLGDGI